MTRKASWKIALALLTAFALVATPLALAQGGAPDDAPARGKDRATDARADRGEDDADAAGAAANASEEERDGPPAWVREAQDARANGTWVPPGLLVALEHVPDAVKSRIQGLIEAWSNGTRGQDAADEASVNATGSEDVEVVQSPADDDANGTEERGADARRGPPAGAGAQGHAHAERGLTKALDRVPDAVRAKLTAFWSFFA